ncbi:MULTISPECIES: hypothetical protein [Sphingosinicellaceae]|uniref:hypothetical protein n=1 Tax=Sphingosinicellaceae TaxID=2820280 RepID=UPI001C1DCEC3|nr:MULTISPECIES: hypothetical protein [Polymorphobacter]QYE34087.1 hypothetical protein KZX46_14965 [Polymorphobacter sp. PAMC 29334]UAJ09265.1 hypothetical protein KTC28_13145 [Polymorphobacter megasporae]
MAISLNSIAIALVAFSAAASANAGMVCRGSVVTGFEREARIAAATLGATTSNPAALRIYSTHTTRGYYYESNFVRPGQQSPTKIVSDVPMTPRQVVNNVMFVSQAEVAANTAATQIALAASNDTVQFASLD